MLALTHHGDVVWGEYPKTTESDFGALRTHPSRGDRSDMVPPEVHTTEHSAIDFVVTRW